MADSVFKLTVDSKEYDSKIARAAQGLAAFEKQCREVGGTLEFVEKEDLAFVQALGKMDTVATSTTGKIGELKKAFLELSVQYKNLTEAEKNSPYGKALANSLDQLKGRLKGLESDMKGAQGQLVDMKDAFGQLAGKLGVPTQMLTKLGLAIGGVTAAIKVGKDAFFASESNIDEWGRTVAAAQSIYESFLTSLNTGDISGFLSRIGEIIQSANDAYNALDRLGTQKAINNAAYQQQNVENERNRAMLRTGRYIAPNDGRPATMAEGAILTDAQKKQIATELEQGLKALNQIVRDEIDQTTNAINALYTKQANALNMSEEEFRKGTSSMAEFDKRLEGYAKYVAFNDETKKLQLSLQGEAGLNATDEQLSRLNQKNPYSQYKAWGVFKDDGDLFSQINNLINQRAALQTQNYGQMAQAYRSINTATGVSARGGGGEEAPVTEGSIKAQEQEVARLTELWKNATTELRDGYKQQLDEAKATLDQMVKGTAQVPTELNPSMPGRDMTAFEKLQQSISIKLADSMQAVDMSSLTNLMGIAIQNGIDSINPEFEELQYKMSEGFDIPDETWIKLQDKINVQRKALNLDPIKLNVDTGAVVTATQEAKTMQGSWQMAASAISAAGAAMQMIEDPAAKVAGIIAQAIAQVALGAGQAIAFASNGSAGGPWGWLAFAISATATMVSTIAAIKSATSNSKGFAQGGIVGGTTYSGDQVVARLNSGEGVLTRTGIESAAKMASAFDGRGGGGSASTPYVSGENIVLGVNNYFGRSGQGEIVTTSMLRRAGINI